MKVQILQLLEGARKAEGLTVIIDVFRAFSVECYAMASGVKRIYPVGNMDKAFALRDQNPGAILVGERNGYRCEGFDCGNSPSSLVKLDLKDRVMVHTTSAGTQGIANAVHADELLGGALVNAAATANYIRSRNPKIVSLVCMGWNGTEQTDEDTLCAEYLAALLQGENPDISAKIERLKETTGKKFFDPKQWQAFPMDDFGMCTQLNRFPFALRLTSDANGAFMEKIEC